MDNEGAGRQQEGEFEVLEGRRGQGAVPVHDTGEAAAGGFWGEVWVLISGVCAHGPSSGRPDGSVVLHNRVAYAVVTQDVSAVPEALYYGCRFVVHV